MNKIDFKRGDSIPTRSTRDFQHAGILGGFESLLSSFTADSNGFFISGCAVSEAVDGGNVTVSIAAGHVSFAGEPFAVESSSIVRLASEVAWLEITESFVDATPTNNTEGVGRNVKMKRVMALQKGSNYPGASEHLKLDATTQMALLEAKLSGRLMRVGSVFIWTGTLDNFDNTGLGLVGTAAAGLAKCNGNNGTIDMRGLAAVGAIDTGKNTGAGSLPAGVASNYSLNDVFGAENVSLTEAQLPEHNVSYDKTTLSATGGAGTVEDGTGRTVNITQTDSANVGGDEEHENRQPSRAVLFVQVIS